MAILDAIYLRTAGIFQKSKTSRNAFFDQNHLLALFRCEFMILMIRRGGVKVERGLANDKIILTNKTLSNINSCLMMTDPRIS